MNIDLERQNCAECHRGTMKSQLRKFRDTSLLLCPAPKCWRDTEEKYKDMEFFQTLLEDDYGIFEEDNY